jgi:hypothetical protein
MHTQPRRLRLARAATLVAALIAAASAPVRADDTSGQRFVCRTIVGGETPNAQMTAASATQLICRPIEITLKMSGGSLRTIGRTTAKTAADGPDLSQALTPEQVNDAYVRFIDQEFHIDHNS